MEADFEGYATKANIKCSDGRTITPQAFEQMDGARVPLVWQHMHNDPDNVLGHGILSHRQDGVWVEAYFNDTKRGETARQLVEHGDVDSLSIYANSLVEKSKQVFHGVIREVSLVLSGANPGAKIQNVRLAHGDSMDDVEILEDEAIIYLGELSHSDGGESDDEESDDENDNNEEEELDAQEVYDSLNDEQLQVVHSMLETALQHGGVDREALEHADGDLTVKQVFDAMTQVQKDVVFFMIGTAVEAEQNKNSAKHSAMGGDEMEGGDMSRNVFESQNGSDKKRKGSVLSHSDLETIQENALKVGSYKEAFMAHAESLGYGIDDIEFLFPDAKSIGDQPDLIARRTEWVANVLDGAKHSPFSRVKSLHADLTAEEARAKGYVKGNKKKDEIVRLLKRKTEPTTIYKKQKLDRDDIVDITDLDVVAWLKWEMRFMLEEEIARAILVGDGRDVDSEDKIDEERLRPIAWDDDMYAHKINVPADASAEAAMESVIRSRKYYKGTGTPTLYTTEDFLTDMLLLKDGMKRRLYNNEAEVAQALRVSRIVTVEVMEETPEIVGIIVNMADYTIGADKGGQTAMFDDFDIDYNQYKYLIETRISGALVKAKSALVLKRASGNTSIQVEAPKFDEKTGVLSVPTVEHVKYYNVTAEPRELLTSGQNVNVATTMDVLAEADAGYEFAHGQDNDWVFSKTGK